MDASQKSTAYDLKERTYLFAKRVRALVKILPRTLANIAELMKIFGAMVRKSQ